MIDKNTTVEITISVNISCIVINDVEVSHEKETRTDPESYDVKWSTIEVEGLPEEYEIVDSQDAVIDQLAFVRWQAGEME